MRDDWWFGIGAQAAALGERSRRVPPLFVDGSAPLESEVGYQRTELGARLTLGHGTRGSSALGGLEGGLAWIAATGTDPGDGAAGEKTRVVGFVGLGGDLRYEIASGLAFALGGGAVFQPSQRSYLAHGAPAFDEGLLQLRARIGLVWRSRH
jgi:hypothetical protein